MFHNVLMTTLAPIRDTNEIDCWNNRPFTTIWPETKQEKFKGFLWGFSRCCQPSKGSVSTDPQIVYLADTNVKKTIKKKKRNRTIFTTEQVRALEKLFSRSKYIDLERRREISECLQVEQKCIKIWFQNRRMKEKKELSENCDSMSETQVSSVESVSTPLESPYSSNTVSGTDYKRPYERDHVRYPYYCYDAPNDYLKAVHQNEPSFYETSSTPIISGNLNYNYSNLNSNLVRNNMDYSAQYYAPQAEFQYYYNTGEVNNPSVTADLPDWPANVFDTSYFQ